MKKLIYVFALFLTGTICAQTPFWTEDFANGIPAGWINADASGQGAIWTWCNDPANNDVAPGCPPIWNDAINNQIPFQATSATNGFATVDSDEYGELPTDHIAELTTDAIDCSSKSKVYITFQTMLGTYTYDADDRAILRVSTDGINWTTYTIFNGLTTTVRWSENPYIPIIDISATAAGKATVYLQWQWKGNWDYNWSIDDIEIYGQNPTPKHDLAISDVYFPLFNYATPASEIKTDTSIFYAYISNNGLEDQHNIKLKVWVTDSNNGVLYADSTGIGALPVGYVDSLMIIPSLYIPDVDEGEYTIHYALSADSTDGRLADNVRTSTFLATSTQFSKEDGPEQFYRPSTLTDPWYVGNYYKMSNKSIEKYKAVSIDFAHTVNATEIPITLVNAGIYLLQLHDTIADDLSNLNETDFFGSYEWIGLGDYAASDSTVDDGSLRNVELYDLTSGEPGILLETGGRYVAAISYAGASNKVFQGYNDDNKYGFYSTLEFGGGYLNFGDDVNAVIRLNLSLLSTSDDVALPDASMQVFPNPATDRINLDVNLEVSGPATVTICDLSGRIIVTQDYDQLQREVLTLKLPKLASGTYLARIATQKGTLTRKFSKI